MTTYINHFVALQKTLTPIKRIAFFSVLVAAISAALVAIEEMGFIFSDIKNREKKPLQIAINQILEEEELSKYESSYANMSAIFLNLKVEKSWFFGRLFIISNLYRGKISRHHLLDNLYTLLYKNQDFTGLERGYGAMMSQVVEKLDPSKKKDPRLMWISLRYNELYTQKQWDNDFNNYAPLPKQPFLKIKGVDLYKFIDKP